MKTIKLIALAAFALLFSCCKATQPTEPPTGGTSSTSISDVQSILDSTAITFAQFDNATGNSPQQAMILTENWLKTQSTVHSIFDVDSTYLYITLSSGLTTTFSFDQRGADGLSLNRGGGSKANPKARLIDNQTPSRHTLSNKNVLIYAAAYSEFYLPGEMQTVVNFLKNSEVGLTVNLLTDQQCTYQTIDNLSNYALVILDTHGSPDAFLTGSKVILPSGKYSDSAVKASIDKQLGAGTSNLILSGDLRISHVATIAWNGKYNVPKADTEAIWITSKHISTLTNLSKTMIFGNMCYSGSSVPPVSGSITPIATAFNSLNPISYFCYGFDNGYSTGVHDNFAKLMEDSLVWDLFIDYDSTGFAYRKIDTTRFYDPNTKSISSGWLYFKHYGADDYSYMPCIDSFTDARDGHLYHTRCFGDQVWMQEDLNYNAPGSFTYANSAANGKIYGRIYPWKIAMGGAASSNTNPSSVKGICPYGWHVPSEVEWQQLRLMLALGSNEAAGLELNSADTSIGGWALPGDVPAPGSNSSGFTALAGGWFNYDNLTVPPNYGFGGIHNVTQFLTSTLNPSGNPWVVWLSSGSPTAKIDVNQSISTKDPNQPSSNAYCRCVKDP